MHRGFKKRHFAVKVRPLKSKVPIHPGIQAREVVGISVLVVHARVLRVQTPAQNKPE